MSKPIDDLIDQANFVTVVKAWEEINAEAKEQRGSHRSLYMGYVNAVISYFMNAEANFEVGNLSKSQKNRIIYEVCKLVSKHADSWLQESESNPLAVIGIYRDAIDILLNGNGIISNKPVTGIFAEALQDIERSLAYHLEEAIRVSLVSKHPHVFFEACAIMPEHQRPVISLAMEASGLCLFGSPDLALCFARDQQGFCVIQPVMPTSKFGDSLHSTNISTFSLFGKPKMADVQNNHLARLLFKAAMGDQMERFMPRTPAFARQIAQRAFEDFPHAAAG